MPEEEALMNFAEADAELEQLLAVVQDRVGGEEWQSSDTLAEPCELASGGSGAWAARSRTGQGIAAEQQQALLDAVIEEWTAAGYRPTVITPPS